MSFAKFLKSGKFLTHLLLAIVIAFLLIVITLQGLKWYTLHGEASPVPDFEGRTVKEAVQLARQNELRLEILDSLYVDDAPPGAGKEDSCRCIIIKFLDIWLGNGVFIARNIWSKHSRLLIAEGFNYSPD